MTAFNKKILAVTTAVALGFGVTSAAHAGAKAYANLEISDFQLFNEAGQQWSLFDFALIAVENRSTARAELDGVVNAPPSATGPGDVSTAMACVGACAGISDTDFTQQPPDHFSRGNSDLVGAIITDVPAATADFATAQSVAETQLTQTGAGDSNSFVGTSTTFRFELVNDDIFDFRFAGDLLAEARLDQPEFTASGGNTFSITISAIGAGPGQGFLFSWSPDGTGARTITGGGVLSDPCSLQLGASVTGTVGSDSAVCSGNFQATTNTLFSGQTYSITISHESNSNARVEVVPVPEPATLGLFGAGLIGIAAMRRRSKVNASA